MVCGVLVVGVCVLCVFVFLCCGVGFFSVGCGLVGDCLWVGGGFV